MARPRCSQCQFPASHCLCHQVVSIETKTQLVVLQHPSEVNHAKNSVRLLPLCLDNVRIEVGETQDDFTELKTWLLQQTRPIYLLYPSEDSQDISQADSHQDAILLVIDGTWRKAHKILMLNPWLLELTQLSIEPIQPSNYKIRKSKRSDSLSSLEAAALGINVLEPEVNISPLLDLFDAMIEQQLAAMPKNVRQRYQ